MSIESALKEFCSAAKAKGDFASPAKRDHALHQSMALAWQKLYSEGPIGQAAFHSLLQDESKHVRLWAAAQMLAESESEAINVLEAEAQTEGLHGTAARILLEQFQAGQYRPPFGGSLAQLAIQRDGPAFGGSAR